MIRLADLGMHLIARAEVSRSNTVAHLTNPGQDRAWCGTSVLRGLRIRKDIDYIVCARCWRAHLANPDPAIDPEAQP